MYYNGAKIFLTLYHASRLLFAMYKRVLLTVATTLSGKCYIRTSYGGMLCFDGDNQPGNTRKTTCRLTILYDFIYMYVYMSRRQRFMNRNNKHQDAW